MPHEDRLSLLRKLEEETLMRQTSLEERRQERQRCTLAVDYTELDRIFTGYTRDISASGAFILTQRSFQVGEELYLQINFPQEQYPFKIQAEVVRTAPEGVGLKFRFKSQVQQEIITSLIRNIKEPDSIKRRGKSPSRTLSLNGSGDA